MPTAKLSGFAQQMSRFVPETHVAADGDLLAEFVATRDEQAFAELVGRYGPLVFAVCRRVTGSHHLAEDAFQAVFVVLAAKAGCVRPASALAAWLHGVATRTALRARTVADRRRRREAPVGVLPDLARHEVAPAETTDLATVVDEEIARLPDALRVTVVLCELEGCSRKDASERLGVPEGTVSSRLAAARKALAARLRNRGIALSAAGLSAALGHQATASVPAALTARALASAMSPGVVSAPVAALSTGVLRIMFAQKLKAVPLFTVIALAAVACAALATSHELPTVPQPPAAKPPEVVFAPRFAAPAKQPMKGPNKLLVQRVGIFTLYDPDGKNHTPVSENRDLYHPAGGAMLSPDGKQLAVMIPDPLPPDDGTRGAKKRTATLHVRGLDEKEPGTSLDIQGQTLAWSPDGTEIVCCDFVDGQDKKSPEATHQIVNVKTKEKSTLKLPADHILTDWSRDGKFFVTIRVGGGEKPRARLYLMNRNGTEHKALTDENQFALFGRISPDGTRVLFNLIPNGLIEKPDPQKAEMAVVDISTRKVTKVNDVPLNGMVLNYCWAPDGKKIAYIWLQVHKGKPEELDKKETESHLIVCDPDGKNAMTILSEKGEGQWNVTLGSIDWR